MWHKMESKSLNSRSAISIHFTFFSLGGKIGKRIWSACWLPGIPDRVIQSGDRPSGQVGNASNPESPRITNIHPQILASQ